MSSPVSQLEELPGYQEFQARKDDLSVVLRPALPKTDLTQRIRSVGALTTGLEDPAAAVLCDPEASDREKCLARKVLDAASGVSNEVAELLVDLAQSKEIITVLDGRAVTV
jgi:hypothetical protein